jgi:hypothetical protein
MSRILAKAVGHDQKEAAMGIVLSALPGSRRPQSMYLEGYGALFLLNVQFPLVPPAKEDEKAEKQADTTWEKTKQELYGSRTGNMRIWNDRAVEYDQQQVDDLKKDVLDALKNAGNIRAVKPDESITVAVLGNHAGGPGRFVKSATTFTPDGARKTNRFYTVGDRARVGAGRETTLIIRAKKSDVDAFNKGTIESDEFKKRASISAY